MREFQGSLERPKSAKLEKEHLAEKEVGSAVSHIRRYVRKEYGKVGRKSCIGSVWIRHKQVGLGLLDLLREGESPVDVDG